MDLSDLLIVGNGDEEGGGWREGKEGEAYWRAPRGGGGVNQPV